MGCIRKLHRAGPQVHHTEPHRDEHPLLIVLAQLGIGKLQGFGGALAGKHKVFDERLGRHHEQRCRHAFAGNICDHDSQLLLSDPEIIIEIAADFSCSFHASQHHDLRITVTDKTAGRKR